MPRAGLRVMTVGVALLAGIAAPVELHVRAQMAPATFERDVAPIIYSRCAYCHGAGGNAPFSLAGYDDVAPRARAIAQVAQKKLMPPWKPTIGGPFVGERSLSASELLTLVDWAGAGAPRGTWSGTAPPAPPGDWRLGIPDLVVALSKPYVLSPSGDDEFRTFVLPVPVKETRYVEAVEINVGPGRAIRHVDLRIDPTDASRQRDREDDEPGFDDDVNAPFPDGYLVTWTPGTSATPSAKGSAWRLQPGVDLVLQVQLRRTGYLELVRPRVAFHFANRTAGVLPVTLRLGGQDRETAPDTAHVARDSYTMPVDVELQAIHPHASERASRVSLVVRFPSGLERTLIAIDNWDVNWQDVYRHVEPVALPRGTTIRTEFAYRVVAPGPGSSDSLSQSTKSKQHPYDEGMWLQVQPKTAADRARLEAAMRN